ncbi:MAG TPA: tRNA pseudouridine(55) synthase TruB [Gemmatimonadales bacterium]|nr:tRNA pseudouridine(55) synthase TruB [Gemmatimonadales bacterium]
MDKPAGPTSHDVVIGVRRALGIRSAGHTGTLDPFASGLMIVLVGRATRLARFVSAQPKRYLATARLGFATTTDDLMGEPLAQEGAGAELPDRSALSAALESFRGTSMQRPPAFSARHVDGERSYRLARRGVDVALPETPVTVHDITLVEAQDDRVVFRTTVSAGTYVRAIARDLGQRLGSGAHLTALRREAIGEIEVSRGVPLGSLTRDAAVLSPLEVVAHLPSRVLDEAAAGDVSHGRSIAAAAGAEEGRPAEGNIVALVHDGRLAAVAEVREGRLQPVVVLESA